MLQSPPILELPGAIGVSSSSNPGDLTSPAIADKFLSELFAAIGLPADTSGTVSTDQLSTDILSLIPSATTTTTAADTLVPTTETPAIPGLPSQTNAKLLEELLPLATQSFTQPKPTEAKTAQTTATTFQAFQLDSTTELSRLASLLPDTVPTPISGAPAKPTKQEKTLNIDDPVLLDLLKIDTTVQPSLLVVPTTTEAAPAIIQPERVIRRPADLTVTVPKVIADLIKQSTPASSKSQQAPSETTTSQIAVAFPGQVLPTQIPSLPTFSNRLPLSALPSEARDLQLKLTESNPQAATVATQPSVLSTAELSAPATPEDRNAAVLARTDRAEFVNRVTEALTRAAAVSPQRIKVDLNPPSLGQIRLQVVNEGGQLTARIEANSSDTVTLLRDSVPSLQNQLDQPGSVPIHRITIEHAPTQGLQTHAGLMNGQSNGQNGSSQQQQRQKWRSNEEDDGSRSSSDALTIANLLALSTGMDRLI